MPAAKARRRASSGSAHDSSSSDTRAVSTTLTASSRAATSKNERPSDSCRHSSSWASCCSRTHCVDRQCQYQSTSTKTRRQTSRRQNRRQTLTHQRQNQRAKQDPNLGQLDVQTLQGGGFAPGRHAHQRRRHAHLIRGRDTGLQQRQHQHQV